MIDTLFKGYVRTKNKQSIDRFKDVPLKSLDEVKDLDEYAGVLEDDIILVDVDDEKQSEILMDIVEDRQINCRVYDTTRGRHFLFKNTDEKVKQCTTHSTLACGLMADIKIGTKSSYEVLKFNGEERFIEWDCETLDEIPFWLMPVKTKINFTELGEGDGRNQELFNYILRLTEAGLSKDQSRECIQIINRYVLKDSLPESEIETITRDGAFPKDTFMDGNKFRHDLFAQFLKNNDHIVKIDGQLYVYRDGVYVQGQKEIEAKMIKYIPTMRSTARSEVLKYLEITCDEVKTADANLIAFANGIYDIATDQLMAFDQSMVVTNKIPWNYDPQSFDELADKTLDKLACGDRQIRLLLEECIGYCFYRRNELSKAFILTGDKSNGKSTFLDMVKNLLGESNVSNLDLSELDERFSTASMASVLANIGDDISDEFLQGRVVATFKKIVSGNRIKAEFKGQDPFFFNPYLKMLFSANDIPRIKDKTGAVLRRLVIVPFRATFSKDDPDYDPFIVWKLKTESVMKYLVRIGLDGLKRVLINKSFTTSDQVTKEIQDYEYQNNPIMMFIDETPIEEIVNQSCKQVHLAYKVFCQENGFMEMTLSNFSKELNKRLGVSVVRTRFNGKQVGMYVKGR